MDLISAFKSELFRPLTTIIVPGSFAVSPWLLILAIRNDDVASLISKYPSTFTFVFIFFAVAAGFILENIGARIEHCWDEILKLKYTEHMSKWDEYLRLEIKDEIIGQRYLETIVTRMKFELAFGPALILSGLGMFVYNFVADYWDWSSFLLSFLLVLVLAGYLIWESYHSADVAAKTRNQILEGAKVKYERCNQSKKTEKTGASTV